LAIDGGHVFATLAIVVVTTRKLRLVNLLAPVAAAVRGDSSQLAGRLGKGATAPNRTWFGEALARLRMVWAGKRAAIARIASSRYAQRSQQYANSRLLIVF
jgi:hypothetical protein